MEGGRHIHYLDCGGFTGVDVCLNLSNLCYVCEIHNCVSLGGGARGIVSGQMGLSLEV